MAPPARCSWFGCLRPPRHTSDPGFASAFDRATCGIAGCGEVAERCATHLQDRIAASMRKDAANAAALPVRTGGRAVPDDEMRGPAWSAAGRVR